MAELKQLNMYDEENDESYSFFVTEEEWSRAYSEPDYGVHLLHKYIKKGYTIAHADMSPIDTSCAPVDYSSHQENIVPNSQENIVPNSQDSTSHNWTEDETILWIDCYAKEGVHLLTQKKDISAALKRASTTFNEILFKKKGIIIQHQKCISKMDLLKRIYKEKLDLKNQSGGAADKWPFFDLMHALFQKERWVKPLSVAGNGIPHNIDIPATRPRREKPLDKLLEKMMVERRLKKEMDALYRRDKMSRMDRLNDNMESMANSMAIIAAAKKAKMDRHNSLA